MDGLADEFDKLDVPDVALPWVVSDRSALSIRPSLLVEPMTIFTIIAAIVDKFMALQRDAAEKEFRDAVLRQLDSIQRQLVALQQELAEIGVLLAAAIGDVPVVQASGTLAGELVALQTAYPELKRDGRRATERFDSLNQAAAAAASYGPALLPQIAVAFTALLSILALRGGSGSRVLQSLRAAWRPAFGAMLDPNVSRSLTSQQAVLRQLADQASHNLDEVPLGRFKVGTHNYGRTNVFVTVARQDENTFSIAREDVDDPEAGAHESSGGSGGGDFGVLLRFLVNAATAMRKQALPTQEFYLYCVGQRTLVHPHDVWGQFGDGDHHGDVYNGWIADIYGRIAQNADVRAAARAGLASLNSPVDLASRLLAYCSQQ